ncbi:unnamed protein product [Rotaria sordida]|uniref:Uncharacterized protein n=1 Tax=Rotaria sordida TaxID=392033 RepID=A0A815KWT4_9BILA|nr:unnamed protein product [Rotaria sordida]CAF1401916.1 unnamed protein product [Rotaria sordida]
MPTSTQTVPYMPRHYTPSQNTNNQISETSVREITTDLQNIVEISDKPTKTPWFSTRKGLILGVTLLVACGAIVGTCAALGLFGASNAGMLEEYTAMKKSLKIFLA